MADELDEAMLDNAIGPKRAQDEAGSMEQHSIPDQIALDRYRANKTNAARKGFPIKICRIIPPGATGY